MVKKESKKMRIRMMIDLETPQTEEEIKQVYVKMEDYEAKLEQAFIEGWKDEGVKITNINAKAVTK